MLEFAEMCLRHLYANNSLLKHEFFKCKYPGNCKYSLYYKKTINEMPGS